MTISRRALLPAAPALLARASAAAAGAAHGCDAGSGTEGSRWEPGTAIAWQQQNNKRKHAVRQWYGTAAAGVALVQVQRINHNINSGNVLPLTCSAILCCCLRLSATARAPAPGPLPLPLPLFLPLLPLQLPLPCRPCSARSFHPSPRRPFHWGSHRRLGFGGSPKGRPQSGLKDDSPRERTSVLEEGARGRQWAAGKRPDSMLRDTLRSRTSAPSVLQCNGAAARAAALLTVACSMAS